MKSPDELWERFTGLALDRRDMFFGNRVLIDRPAICDDDRREALARLVVEESREAAARAVEAAAKIADCNQCGNIFPSARIRSAAPAIVEQAVRP